MTAHCRNEQPLRILVTGATGCIGGRLAPRLVAAGYRVRTLARNPDKISDVPWAADVEVVQGDLADPASLDDACRGIDVVYYLVHSEVFAYLADFRTTEPWDPATLRTFRLGGDGGVGTPYATTARFPGLISDLVYEVVAMTRFVDRAVRVEHVGDRARHARCRPAPERSELGLLSGTVRLRVTAGGGPGGTHRDRPVGRGRRCYCAGGMRTESIR